ncbi:cytochrome c oxidase subunit 3 [Sporichthya polymorpha]|uniref:cytochrome c oxidase subunit 3 n=1 Tax=Sporichthya polymorpha TaxID=35751 RepID=UPI000380EBDC|nr:cytochrome c oxidase subunit 3 [Sporichthya polymorpha]
MTLTENPRDVRTDRPAAIPGEPGLWLFMFADMLLFAALFGIVIYVRDDQPAMFAESQATLNQTLGLINTLLLLTGSLFVAMAVHGNRTGAGRPDRLVLGAIGCGFGFLAIKALEWGSSIADGHTVSTNDFFQAYYMLTGIHLAHVTIGLGLLFAMWRELGRPQPRRGFLEGSGCYWHLVDLLWVVLFPLIYLTPVG